jgi:hypothetical protein
MDFEDTVSFCCGGRVTFDGFLDDDVVVTAGSFVGKWYKVSIKVEELSLDMDNNAVKS